MSQKNSTRRTFVGLAAAACGALVTPPKTRAVVPDPIHSAPGSSSYLEILRPPDLLIAYSGLDTRMPLARSGDHWGSHDIEVQTTVTPGASVELPLHLRSPHTALTHLH
ncbi:MAG: twin-arginine translocation signal domain-containing protein, partial [Acidobacteriaceae bacterium]